MRQMLLSFPFYRWRNWGSEILSGLCKVTQPGDGRIWDLKPDTWAVCKPNSDGSLKRYRGLMELASLVRLIMCYLFIYCQLHHTACRILALDQVSNLCPLQWKRRVLTTGQSRKSLIMCFLECNMLSKDRDYETLLEVQWLRLCLSMKRVWVRSLAGELRSHMLWGPENQNIKQAIL